MDFEYVNRGIVWADECLTGKRACGRLAKLAIERFERDIERAESDPDFPYYFDAEEGERWLDHLSQLPHVRGRWARNHETFDPTGYQCFIVMNLYGWRHEETGMRRFREGYIEIGRKNGKSFLGAGLGLGHLAIDNEYGAEVYSGATSEKQAWEVFRPARQMCLNAEHLAGEYEIEINAKSLWIMSEGSRFEPLIGNPGDGAGPSCAIIDEFHEHKTSAMYDTMATGMGSRDQPMLLIITTAGVDFGGPCREKRQDVVRILENSVQDETVFAIIFTIDEGDDWTAIESIEKANPNLGVSINREFLLAELEKAKRNPTKQVAFKTKHLNMWVGAKAAGINMLELQRCQKKIRLTKKYRGRVCFPALDLASKWDIAAMALLFPREDDQVDAFFRFWLPEETVRESPNDRYRAWADTDQIIVTPGNVIDYKTIEDEVLDVCRTYSVPCVGYDPWQATQLSQNLMAQGINMIEIRPTVLNFSEPFKELQARIKNQRWRYNDDVFTWMAGNVVATLDKKDNIYPDKERAENKIDGVVAAIMAMNRLLSDDGPSVYETRGMLG